MSRRSRFQLPLAGSFLAIAILAMPVGRAAAQDADFSASDLVVRLNRLEGQIRTLSGQVEQQQFDNRQLKEQLRKFQEDTEFRFQERSGGGGARSGTAPAPPPSTTPASGARPQRRGDAFDPDTSPTSPGAPRTLGSASESGTGDRRQSRRGPSRRASCRPQRHRVHHRGGGPARDGRFRDRFRRGRHGAIRLRRRLRPLQQPGNTIRPRLVSVAFLRLTRAIARPPTRPTGSATACFSATSRVRRPNNS